MKFKYEFILFISRDNCKIVFNYGYPSEVIKITNIRQMEIKILGRNNIIDV